MPDALSPLIASPEDPPPSKAEPEGTAHADAQEKSDSGATLDLIVIVAVSAVAFFLAESYNVFERLDELSRRHEDLHLDEMFVVGVILSAAFAVFSFRRWRELQSGRSALALANQRLQALLEETKTKNREAALISGMADLLQSCFTLPEASDIIARAVQQLCPNASGALYLFSPSRNDLEPIASWGPAPPGETAFAPGDCWALRRGRLYAIEGGTNLPPCGHVGSRVMDYVCVPMMAHGETMGILNLFFAPEARQAGITSQKAALALIAEHAALVLANLKLREVLRDQSIRDPLTGLFNRRYLEESFERELRVAQRKKYPVGFILFDLDHFKRFNDTHGHEAGDLLLREVGLLIRSHFRGSDLPCRFGGEEFAIILPDSSAESTRRRADELREAIRHLGLQYRGQTLGVVTVSLGIAILPEHGSTPGDLLRAADAALYQAKAGGRDRTVLAPTAA